MNIQSLNKDINDLEKALRLVEKTENYLHFAKSHVISELCVAINQLKDKRDNQLYTQEALN